MVTPTSIELTMPITVAEKMIAEYDNEHVVELEPAIEPTIPIALADLFDKMAAKDLELGDAYYSALPKDEFGDTILPDDPDFPEGYEVPEYRELTLEDYLRLKFPEAEDEELHRDYCGNIGSSYSDNPEFPRLERAFEIDNACCRCLTPDNCALPEGSHEGDVKPEATLLTDKEGRRYLGIKLEGCVRCKHKHPKPQEKSLEQKRQEREFECNVKASGMSPRQQKYTFEAYGTDGATPDVVVAKAQAILAAKRGTNLVLAGNVGTGKTHLAAAIAREVMRDGRQAIMASIPDMLLKMKQANRDNQNAVGLIRKYESVPCLVLDDWGHEYATDAAMDYLYQIINYRYENELQTIVTTTS